MKEIATVNSVSDFLLQAMSEMDRVLLPGGWMLIQGEHAPLLPFAQKLGYIPVQLGSHSLSSHFYRKPHAASPAHYTRSQHPLDDAA